MKGIIIFILVVSFPLSLRGKVSFPNSFPKPSILIQNLRTNLKIKILELRTNYIPRLSQNRLSYISYTGLICSWKWQSSHSVLASIQLNTKKVKNGNVAQINYSGCRNQLVFRESIARIGEKVSAPDLQKITFGEIPGDSPKFKTYQYSLFDNMNDEILRWRKTKSKKLITHQMSILGQSFLIQKIYLKNKKPTRMSFHFPSYQYNYRRAYMSLTRSGENRDTLILIKINDKGLIQYFHQGIQISFATFLKMYNSIVQEQVLKRMQKMVKYNLYLFPSTKVQQSANQNRRILDELRSAFIRVVNKQELILVRNLIQQYISAIQKGDIVIIDKRKKQ